MNNIPQNELFEMIKTHFQNTLLYSNNLTYPFEKNPSIFHYASLIETMSKDAREFQRDLVVKILEQMDLAWRNRPGRTKRYYVKDTRYRTLVTLFGPITYKRTIYQDVDTKEIYCYVDETLKFPKYDRYDPIVKIEMALLYSNLNSMIKVGQILGRQIFEPFAVDSDYTKFAIPRQTIQKSILSLGKVVVPKTMKKSTPKIIYIMADEKWVPLQNKDAVGAKQKAMVKEVVIFEDIAMDRQKETTITNRHKLIEKTRLMFVNKALVWPEVYTALGQLYDIEKINKVYIMGDGANWIQAGKRELTDSSYTTDFIIDSFHINQAIIRITSDADIQEALRVALKDDRDKKMFQTICDSLISEKEERTDVITFNMKYIFNNWSSYHKRLDTVTMPCAMEGSISHDIASFATSVPKAYISDNLDIYMANRTNHLNGVNIINTYLKAVDIKKDDEEEVIVKDTLYLSHPSSRDYVKPNFLHRIESGRNSYSKF